MKFANVDPEFDGGEENARAAAGNAIAQTPDYEIQAVLHRLRNGARNVEVSDRAAAWLAAQLQPESPTSSYWNDGRGHSLVVVTDRPNS